MMFEEREREQNEVYFKDRLNEEQLLDEMESNKRSFLGITIKNSPLYNDVMEKLHMLTNKLYEPIYDKTDNAKAKRDKLTDSITKIQLYYLSLLESCSRYLYTHSSKRWTSSGEERRSLIREIYDQAHYEIDCLDQKNIHKILELYVACSEITFKDILKDLRTEVIDITGREDIENFGGNTSSGLSIGDGENKRFFKPKEITLPSINTDCDLSTLLSKQMDKFCTSKEENEAFIKIFYSDNSLRSYMKGEFLNIENNDFEVDDIRDFDLKVFLKKLQVDFSTDEKDNVIISGFKFTPESISRFYYIISEYKRLFIFSCVTNDGPIIQPNVRIDIRNVATSRLFETLGEQDLVAKSRLAILSEQESFDIEGIIMNKAEGKPVQELLEDLEGIEEQNIQIRLSKDAQKKFADLQFGDYIAGQVDRHECNYFIDYTISGAQGIAETADVHITYIQGIDNDMSFGLLNGSEVLSGKVDGLEVLSENDTCLPPFFNRSKTLSLPYIDKNFVDRLQSINEIIVDYILADLLTQEEMDALVNRIKAIKETIVRNYSDDQKLDRDGWDQNSLNATLEADNYLSRLIKYVKDVLRGKNLSIISD